jgi:hypothetical protein
MNIAVVRAHRKAVLEGGAYRTRMHQFWCEEFPEHCCVTEQRVADQWHAIRRNTMLTDAEIEQIEQSVGQLPQSVVSDTDDDDRQFGEEQLQPHLQNENTEPTVQPHDDQPTEHACDEQLKQLFLDHLEDVKLTDMKDRKRLPVLRMQRGVQQDIDEINKIFDSMKTGEETLTDINHLMYAAAVTVTTKWQPPPRRARQSQEERDAGPPWKRRLQRRIDETRSDISRLVELKRQRYQPRISAKLYKIKKKYKADTPEAEDVAIETLKQRVAAWAQRIRRYTKRVKQYRQNKQFATNQKQFYRELSQTEI